MEPEHLLPCLQESVTCSWPEPYEPNHSPYIPYKHFNIILPSMTRFPKWSVTSGFRTNILYLFLIYHIRATWSNNLIFFDLITVIFRHNHFRGLKLRSVFSICRWLIRCYLLIRDASCEKSECRNQREQFQALWLLQQRTEGIWPVAAQVTSDQVASVV
jgi:hypothetical protein